MLSTLLASAALIGAVIALLFIFFVVYVVTDNHLVPTVEVFIVKFEIPETVAAVTLVAFGSATPELLLQSVAAIEKTNDISLSAILGSAMIAFGLIPPLCLLSTSHVELKLRAWPVIRETGFYILGLSVFLLAIEDGVVTTEEAIMMSSIYVVYVGTVVGIYMLSSNTSNSKRKGAGIGVSDDDNEVSTGLISNQESRPTTLTLTPPRATRRTASSHDLLSASSPSIGTFPSVRLNSNSPHRIGALNAAASVDIVEDVEVIVPVYESAMASLSALLQKYISRRVEVFVACVVPSLNGSGTGTGSGGGSGGNSSNDSRLLMDDDEDDMNTVGERVSLFRAVWCLTTCIIYVGLLASLIVALCHRISHLLGIGGSTVGATLVALGSEIPDTISSISLAKKGYTDGAMSGAIGSQVINISLGVGLPALFVCMTGNGLFFVEQTDSLWLLTSLAFVVIFMHVSTTLPVWNLIRGLLVKHAAITKNGAIMQVLQPPFPPFFSSCCRRSTSPISPLLPFTHPFTHPLSLPVPHSPSLPVPLCHIHPHRSCSSLLSLMIHRRNVPFDRR